MKIISKISATIPAFTADTKKEAYLAACKWVANNILACKNTDIEVGNITWNIQFDKLSDFPKCVLTVYYVFDESGTWESRCKACKEFHCSFFINEAYDCKSCKSAGYRAEMNQKTINNAKYYQEKLDI
jgi:hypothetical protein